MMLSLFFLNDILISIFYVVETQFIINSFLSLFFFEMIFF